LDLHKVKYEPDKQMLIMSMGQLELLFFGVREIIVNEKVVGIIDCSRIEWRDNEMELIYYSKEDKIIGELKT
jgi:hypothetical protein